MSVIEIDRVVGPVATNRPGTSQPDTSLPRRGPRRPWWLASVVTGLTLTILFVCSVTRGVGSGLFDRGSPGWWAVTAVVHVPYVVIMLFLLGGFVERIGYFWRGRAPVPAGRLPALHPTVCVQLPMFNEHEVARRVIEAAAAMRWPRDRFSVQVLDDSTDADTAALVAAVCAEVRASTGVDCHVRHRTNRSGYKAGALEEGRRATDAEFLAIFDADFVPPEDFLERTIPHFYPGGRRARRRPGARANAVGSSQPRRVGADHGPVAVGRRPSHAADVLAFGAVAVRELHGYRGRLASDCGRGCRRAGGRRASSRTASSASATSSPATAPRSSRRSSCRPSSRRPTPRIRRSRSRWTQGWVQLQKLHLRRLLFQFRCPPLRRLHLVYHMCIAWQWPVWAIWTTTLPIAIYTGHWFGSLGTDTGVLLYLLPTSAWAVLATAMASTETKHTYPDAITPAVFCRRFRRLVPYLVLNTGMLPHQFSSFTEGLFGSMHSEFERTPKAASLGVATPAATKRYAVKIHWPYVTAEAFYVAYQIAWAVLFLAAGLVLCAIGAAYMAMCVLLVAYFYGDHAGKVAFVFDRPRTVSRT